MSTAKFNIGDHVRKVKGSQWKGVVVGTYSTELTQEGYAVESDTERGSVQIYPATALELCEAPQQASAACHYCDDTGIVEPGKWRNTAGQKCTHCAKQQASVEPVAYFYKHTESSEVMVSLEDDEVPMARRASYIVKPLYPAPPDADALRKKSAAQDVLIKSLEAQRTELRAQQETWREAVATLESERAANAVLTAEVERLTQQVQFLRSERPMARRLTELEAEVEQRRNPAPPDATHEEWKAAVVKCWGILRGAGSADSIPSHWLDAMRDAALAARKEEKKHDGPCWRQGSADCGC